MKKPKAAEPEDFYLKLIIHIIVVILLYHFIELQGIDGKQPFLKTGDSLCLQLEFKLSFSVFNITIILLSIA